MVLSPLSKSCGGKQSSITTFHSQHYQAGHLTTAPHCDMSNIVPYCQERFDQKIINSSTGRNVERYEKLILPLWSNWSNLPGNSINPTTHSRWPETPVNRRLHGPTQFVTLLYYYCGHHLNLLQHTQGCSNWATNAVQKSGRVFEYKIKLEYFCVVEPFLAVRYLVNTCTLRA